MAFPGNVELQQKYASAEEVSYPIVESPHSDSSNGKTCLERSASMSQLRRTPASPRSVRSEQRQQLLLREEDEHDEYDVFHPTPMPNQQRAEAIPMDYLSLHVDVGMGGGDSGREIGEPLEREAHQQQSQIGPTRRRLHRRRRSGSFTGEAWPRKARRLHGYSIPPPNVHSTDWRDMIAITDSRPLRLFSQLSYKGNDTDSSPFPPALMRMSSSDLALNRIHWIKENFSRRECAKFVPTNRDPNKCGCGRLRSAHIDIPSIRGISTVNSPSPAVGIILQKVDENNKLITEQSTIRRTGRSVGERWSLRKHTVSLPTDAFGQIEFQGGPHPQKAQYARLSFDTEPSKIMSLFENVWRIAPPRLIITVHGGTNNFDLQPKLARVFRKGLLKAATTTGAWIFTSGVDTGVMRHVAAALEGGSSMSRNKIVCIGISPWGLLKKRDELKGDDMVVPYYPIPTKGRFTTLNNRNNYFLLVDNGTVGRYGAESILRKRLETYIAQKQKIFGGTRSVPVVAVVLEGGSCTIRSVLDYVTNIPRVPVVVCDGSGRAADLLSFTHQVIRDDGSLPDGIRPQLLELVEEVFSCGSPGAEKIVSDLISCAQYKNLITVFRLGEKDRQDVDHAILTALLKGQNLSAADQLSLALAWNRVDIARSDIFTVGQEWSQSALHSAMLEALIHDRVDFVRLLLENGVNMQRFLTFDKLESLYNTDKGPTNTLYYIARDVVRIRRGYHYILPHIGLVIEKLMGNAYKSQYTTHGFKKKYSQFMDKNKTHIRNLRTASKKKSEAMLNRQYTDPAIQIAQSFANSFNGVGPPPGTETNSSIHSEPMLANSGSKALSHHLLWRSAYRREQSSIYPVPTRCTLMDATQEGSELDDESTTGGSEGWKTEEYTFRYPFSELLLWAVLTKRQNMALCLWHHGEEAMAKALVACRLYKSLAAEAAEDYLEVEIREDLRKYADEFRTLSLELLDQCYKQDDTQTLQLLTYELENWSNQTCLSLAVFCNNKQFLAHPSCQILLADLWHGGLRIRSHSNVKVIGGIVFPVSIALMEFKTKDELLNQPQTAMEHESDLNDTPSSTSDSSSSSGDSSSSSFEDEEDDDRRSRRSRKQSVGSVTSLTFSGLFHSKKKKKKEESTSGAKSGEYGTFDGGERAAPIARSRHTSARPHNHNQTPNEKKKINVATISNSQSSLNVFDPYSMSLDVFPQLLPIAPRKRPISFARKLYEFYSAPITTFWLWASSYVLFLALFTYVLLIRTTKHVTILEWIIFTYVVAFGLEHFRRLIMNNEMRSFKQKCLHFFSNFWNTITVLAVGLYLIGFSLRATVSPSYGRVILACDSVLWTLKILDYMSVHHRLGPYVTMAGKMVLNMIYIIIMLFVCLLAFGLARQSITYPNEEWHWILLRNIFYKPYFMLYGEVYADEIDTCGDEAWDSHLENGVPVHIQTNSTSTCPPGFWIPPILMTIFLLVANILLMSMLIAIFNNIFVATDAVAKEIWLFERYRQVMEYESTPFLPPPLTPIYYVHMMIKYFRHDRKNIFDFSLKLFLTPDQVEKLHDFEEDCMEDLHREKKEKKYMSNEERISRTADRTEAILGRLNDASLKDAVNRETLVGLEERLNNMERMQAEILDCLRNLNPTNLQRTASILEPELFPSDKAQSAEKLITPAHIRQRHRTATVCGGGSSEDPHLLSPHMPDRLQQTSWTDLASYQFAVGKQSVVAMKRQRHEEYTTITDAIEIGIFDGGRRAAQKLSQSSAHNSGNESEDEKPEKLTPAAVTMRRTTERETEKAKGAKEETTTTAQEDDEQEADCELSEEDEMEDEENTSADDPSRNSSGESKDYIVFSVTAQVPIESEKSKSPMPKSDQPSTSADEKSESAPTDCRSSHSAPPTTPMAAARAETMSPTYSEFEDKIAVNGVYLVNRHELSEHQDKELQRFIDNNAHIMYFVDREKFPEPRVRRQSTNSNYGELSKKLPRAPSPFDAYKSLDSTFRSKKHIQPDDSEEYRGIPQPYIEGYNYITDFPGIEQPSDNQFLEDILKSGLVKVDKIVDISRPNSPAMSRSGLSPSPSPYNSMSRSQSHQQQQQQQQANAYQTNYPSSQSNYHQSHSNYSTGSYNPPKSHNTGANYNAAPSYNAKSTYNTAPNYNASVNYNTNTGGNYNPSTNYSSNYGTGTGSQYGGSTQYETSYGSTPYASTGHYGSVGNVGQSSTYAYGSSQRSGAGGAAKPPVPPCSPYSSLKRKGVSWVDQDSRARSLSPMMVAPAYQRREVYSAIPQGSTEPTYTYSHTEFKLPPDLTGKQLLEYLSR